MKDVIKFLLFLIYATIIFFLPNQPIVLFAFFINFSVMLFTKCTVGSAVNSIMKYLPFILLTFFINCLLGDVIEATWIAIKLILVCNITFIYSKTTTVMNIAKTIEQLCAPLKLFHINTEEIKILVCISLSMVPILKAEFTEVRMACRAKNIPFNIQNMKIILQKIIISFMKRVNAIDEALIEKGINY